MIKPSKKAKIDHNNSSLDTESSNMDPIPVDIVNEILQRLPAKSITKFIRVSKSWAKIICSNYFIKSFSLQKSMAFQESHRIIFALNDYYSRENQDNWSFFSSSSVKPPLEFISRMVPRLHERTTSPFYVNGLLGFSFGRKQFIISNPSTGKSIVLPPVKSKRQILASFFGFDPIKGEYKILCNVEPMFGHGNYKSQLFPNQVLTFGSNSNYNSLWREIDVWIPHIPTPSHGVCINGVIYYLAYDYELDNTLIIVRFDLKSEKFRKQLPCLLHQHFDHLNLINYESKLVVAHRREFYAVDLWILEDVEKLKWWKISHDLYVFGICHVEILGITPKGETIYICYGPYRSLYVTYHDLKKNQCRSFLIKESEDRYSTSAVTVFGFNDYVESLMLL